MTLREAQEVYHDCLDYVIEHQQAVTQLELHPAGGHLLEIYQLFMQFSNVMDSSPRMGTMPVAQLSVAKFSMEERAIFKEASAHIDAALRMRDDTVRGFADVMQRSIHAYVQDIPIMTGI